MKPLRTIYAVTAAVAVSGTLAVYAGQEQEPQEVQGFVVEQSAGRGAGPAPNTYIVRMHADPVVKYRGSDPRFAPTAPARGQKLNPNDPAVINYASYLDSTHNDALRVVGGGRKLYDYRYAINGFTAV